MSARHGKWAEHWLQCACVRWFALEYPSLRGRLFAVPNGGRRDAVTGALLKDEGVTAGVADLVLLKTSAGRGALLVELKTPSGRLSATQKAWAEAVCRDGEYEYAVCRSVEEFAGAVRSYLDADK